MRYLLATTLFAASLCFALGLTLPLVRVERLYFLVDEPSLVLVIQGLWRSGDIALAIVVCLFSVVFPAAKLLLLHAAALGAPGASIPAWFHAISNWSMLDVVLVALVIFAAKTSGLATAATLPGLWFFVMSVLLTVLASALLRRREKASPRS